MINCLVVLIFATLFTFSAEGRSGSGNELGNGGFVLACQNTSISCDNVIFYDSYEAENRYSLLPKFNHQIDTEYCKGCFTIARDISLFLLKRLEKVDPVLYVELRKSVWVFLYEAKFLADIEILFSEDMGVGFLPPKRVLAQLVVQHEPIAFEDHRYIISRDLWTQMDSNQQASAILHEVIYKEALKNQVLSSSQKIRYFNALLLSDKFSRLSQQAYFDLKYDVFKKK